MEDQIRRNQASRFASRERLQSGRRRGGVSGEPKEKGRLSGEGMDSLRKDKDKVDGDRFARAVRAVSRKVGASPAQVALVWLNASVPVIPILGAKTLAQLKDSKIISVRRESNYPQTI